MSMPVTAIIEPFESAVAIEGKVGCGRGTWGVVGVLGPPPPWRAGVGGAGGAGATRGPTAIRKYGCDTCHTIPGVLSADASVGPPLTQIARRVYLAGRIENTPENMLQWIRHPHSVDDKTVMPEMGVSVQDGRDIVAYLYTLR